jgi:TPR repeat protein
MALYGLARMAPPGGLPADTAAGRQWLERAAQAGDAQAARLLARAYLTGSAGYPAPDKARELLRRSQELGDSASALALARLMARGVGGPADPVAAEQMMRIAADRGDVVAMTGLGRYLTQAATKGWAPSFDEAILWLTRAADHGDASAMEGLGDIHMFLAKAAPAQDPAKGFSWYLRCAEAGRSACHFAVGRAYALAVGAAGDLPRAWAHLSLARDAGQPKAAAELDAVEARMSAAQRAEGVQRLADLKTPAG